METIPMDCTSAQTIQSEKSPKPNCSKNIENSSENSSKVPKRATSKDDKFRGLQRKWRRRGKRQPPTLNRGSIDQTPSKFEMFGTSVEYRVCGTIVMFKTNQVVKFKA